MEIPGPPIIQPTDTFIAVSAGYYHSLAMKSDGTVVGWESESHGAYYGAAMPPSQKFGGLAQGESAFHALGLVKQGGINCYANCDGSTATPFLNVNDYICFTNLVAAGDLRANCDLSQTLPVINVNDLVCFKNLFVIGCD